ncbi:hypothetical protein LTR85_004566 [Meristemomyces frigidus]|nr:hypothetical protein LTR85_004566 [Meristemomyces frigidus]
MGNSESKSQHRPPSRSATLPPPSTSSEKSPPSPSSQPVDVPRAHDGLNEKETYEPSSVPRTEAVYEPSRWDPPRLPLPIEEEDHQPGSPLLSPTELSPLDQTVADGPVTRRTSVLSSTTADDDELLSEQDIYAAEQHSLAPTVPTTLVWKGKGDKVYVTGTFVDWDRKFKLLKDKETGYFKGTLPLKPGTHHLKFLVNDEMITSNELPTTVDYTNALVNYIEVVAALPSATQQQPPAPAEPMPIPGAAVTAGQAEPTGEPATRPLDIRTAGRASETGADLSSTLQDTLSMSAAPTQTAQPTPTPQPAPKPAPAPKPRLPRPQYTKEIPAFLLDLDTHGVEDERFLRAKRVEQNLPQPPSLPMFLGKSILNAATPHKDDASVLTMPNHTVLNHLATSSIKNGVLATSGTTRYKRKFLTTIMHKPTSDEG